MMASLSKAILHGLAGSAALERLASRYGMARPGSFARRFVAGESLDEAIAVARDLQARGFFITLDQLGESVRSLETADAATRVYLETVKQIVDSGIERNLSVKLSQLGLDIDRAVCTDNIRRILEPAGKQGFFVRIDMEASPTIPTTFEIFTTLWEQEYRSIGVVLQSALYRSEEDVKHLNAMGARVRLVKGAYREPRSVAHQRKADVDWAFERIMRTLLLEGTYPAIATHDPVLIEKTKQHAASHGIGRDRFEFQMLYGIRRDLQAALLAEGFRVRVYVPFGRQWFPYFMRRLGERPANIGFVLRSLIAER
jgi:proline dehydrogenase